MKLTIFYWFLGFGTSGSVDKATIGFGILEYGLFDIHVDPTGNTPKPEVACPPSWFGTSGNVDIDFYVPRTT